MNRFNRRRAEAVARKSKVQQTGVTHPSHNNSSVLPTWRMALLGSAAIGAMAVSGHMSHANFVVTGGPTAGADSITVSTSDIIDGGTVDFLAGNDTISVTANLQGANGATVTGGADDDSISFNRRIGEVNNTSGSLQGGAGNDTIELSGFAIIGSNTDSTGEVLGGEGADTITLNQSFVGNMGTGTVDGGADNDSIALTNGSALAELAGSSGLVSGGQGDDTITIDDSRVGNRGDGIVSGGIGNDSIALSNGTYIGTFLGSTGQVLGDAGNDTISLDTSVNIAAFATVDGGAGNDVLSVNFVAGGNAIDFSGFDNFEVVDLNGNATVDIAALPADFSIVGIGDNSTITLATTTVSDLFQIDGTLQGTAGADSVTLNSSSVIGLAENSTGQLLGDAGADTITLDSAYVGFSGAGTVSGGDDNDSIAISSLTNLGYASGSTGQVLGDGGDDTITLDRVIVGRNGSATVSGGADNDSIALSGNSSIADGGTSSGQVLGEAGADTITLDRSFVGNSGDATVSGGEGNDSIALSSFSSIARNAFSTGQVLGDAGEDTITLVQSSVGDRGAGTVSGGADNDSIALSNGSEVGNIAGSAGQVLGDAGDDTITLDGSRVGFSGAGTVSGGEGNDSIALNIGSDIGNEAGSTGQVLGDAGEDTITLNQVSVGYAGAGTVDGGADNDSIALSNGSVVGDQVDSTGQVLGNTGDDTITLVGSRVGSQGAGTVDGGAGDDSIALSSNSSIGVLASGTGQILGDAGADTITLDGTNVGNQGAGTVSGGGDNDSITISGNSNIGYEGGSTGQVLGDAGDDTVTLDNSVVGLRGTATVDTGTGADDLTITNFSRVADAFSSTASISTGDGADSVEVSGTSVFAVSGDATLSTGADNDTISFSGSLGSSASIAQNSTASADIDSGDGDDTLSFDNTQIGVSGDATVDAGLGNDTIEIDNNSSIGAFSLSSSQVLGGEGADSITISNTLIGDLGRATVDGGADADVITLTPVVFGIRTVLGSQAGSEGVILGGDGGDTISLGNSFIGEEGTGRVDGGDGADSIAIDNGEIGESANASGQILGGLGGDTISLSSTNVGDEGNGTVDGGDGDDVIELENGSSIGFETTGSGQVLGGSGSDTIAITGSSVGEEGSATVSGGADGDSITIDGMSAVGFMAGGSGQVLGDGGDDTISVVGSAIGFDGSGTIDGGEGADNISFDAAVVGLNTGSSGQVLGGAGNDTISFNDTDIGVDGAATVNTGAGNDSITLTGTTELGANASINTGAGNDTVSFELTVELDDNAIVDGGTGTDSLIVLASGDQEIDAEAVQGFEQFSASGDGTLTLTGNASFEEGIGAAEDGELTTDGIVTAAGVNVEEDGDFTVDGTLLSTATGDAADNGLIVARPEVTFVTQSTLRNNGTFTSNGGIFVGEDGILAGNGTFNGPVTANNGIISPGNSIGVQTFNNGLTLNGGNTLLIEVSDGAADQVQVVGAVEINGATLQLEDLAPVATDLDAVFTIVDNDGTDLITGSGFGAIVDNLAFLDPTVIINGGDGNDVSLQFRPLEIDVASIATSGNQSAIGEAFNSAPSTDPGIQALLAEFTPLTFAQARAGLNSLSGETHASTQFATGSAGLFFADSVNNALGGFGLGDQARSNNGPTASAALQALALTPEETAARSYPADLVLSDNGVKADRGYVFGRGLYRQSNIDADGNGAATDTQNRGFIAGGGFNFNERFSAGVGIGYLRTDVDVDALNSESETDAIIANIHARYKHNNYDLTGNLGYAFSNIDTERQVAVGGINQRAVADYNADTVFGSAELGYTAVINQFAFRPFVGGAFSYTSTDAFTETGAGAANLVVASSNNTLGQFTVGVSASTQFNVGPALIVPRFEVAYDRLVGDLTPATSAAFQAGGVSFNSVGAAPGRSRGRISAGFAAVLSARVNSFIDYQGIFSGNDRTHAVRSGLKVKF